MPKLTKKRKQELIIFLDSNDRICYNTLCLKCSLECKQSFRATVAKCPRFKKLQNKSGGHEYDECA